MSPVSLCTPRPCRSSAAPPCTPQVLVASSRHAALDTHRWAGPKYTVWRTSIANVAVGLAPNDLEKRGHLRTTQ
eukprot:2775803-Pyramimonas_sp.AAC.1